MESNNPIFSIVFVTPEIPGNTGSIGRTCLALGARLILIKPYGFDLNEKSVRRAGLDYWKHIDLKEYNNWQDFLEHETPRADQLYYFSKWAKKVYYDANFQNNSYLIFGSETKGLPKELLVNQDQVLKIPLLDQRVRSLNLANAATTAAYEALRQIEYNPLTK